ncbi:lanthionine synthetase LanC family protein [Streptomyces noursei]|uniref:lanthionine synthetase LanC family protein n=1 Tax=Streptomyces noursei TaxID=1971 RepID=UPI001E4C1F4B|nr:lanthionine synthetase LanC family protein [Streptomyces noursei]
MSAHDGGCDGIALGALSLGDADLAIRAMEPYLRAAEQTPAGVHWESERGRTSRLHHIAHGTLGIVYGLARVGRATGRTDLVDLARAGAADVVARNEAGSTGFLVPHSDPQDHPDLTARYSYGWCHGPTGDAHMFRLLRTVLDEPTWQTYWAASHDCGRTRLPRRSS